MIPVILSGGAGTRLWPLSRELYPKQFLSLTAEGTTLFQDTLQRLQGLADLEPPLVVANVEQRFLAAEQLLECGIRDAVILLEPERRNSAPALVAAALAAQERYGPQALLLALPADHVVRDAARFRAAVAAGVESAEAGRIVLFGIAPDRPETAYGYLHLAAGAGATATVIEFIEKPPLRRAEAFLRSGEYAWNSGIFLLRVDRYLREIAQYAPKVLTAVGDAYRNARRDTDFVVLDAAALERSPAISIDYAVMEHLHDAVAITLDAGWSDIGTWHALASITESDVDGNVVKGDVFLEDTRNTYVRSSGRLVAVLGARDQVIVETPDAVLVADRSRTDDIRRLVARLGEMGRPERRLHRRVYRPWGWYETMVTGERFQVKHISVKAGASLSLQLHRQRAEHWVVVRGVADVRRGEESFKLQANQSTYIPANTKHRLGNSTDEPLEIIETQSGDYLGEDDIVRFEDDYGREAV